MAGAIYCSPVEDELMPVPSLEQLKQKEVSIKKALAEPSKPADDAKRRRLSKRLRRTQRRRRRIQVAAARKSTPPPAA